jgi:hypothetical protein
VAVVVRTAEKPLNQPVIESPALLDPCPQTKIGKSGLLTKSRQWSGKYFQTEDSSEPEHNQNY